MSTISTALKEASKDIVFNTISWVEANKDSRPSWVKENIISIFIQNCNELKKLDPFKMWYTTREIFKLDNIKVTFSHDNRLTGINFYNRPMYPAVDYINTYIKEAFDEFETKGLTGKHLTVFLDRVHRAKGLGYGEPNTLIVDTRKLDYFNFKINTDKIIKT